MYMYIHIHIYIMSMHTHMHLHMSICRSTRRAGCIHSSSRRRFISHLFGRVEKWAGARVNTFAHVFILYRYFDVYVGIRLCKYLWAYTYMQTHIRLYIYTSMHKYVYIWIYVYIYFYTYIYIYVHMYVYMYNVCTYIST